MPKDMTDEELKEAFVDHYEEIFNSMNSIPRRISDDTELVTDRDKELFAYRLLLSNLGEELVRRGYIMIPDDKASQSVN